MTEKTVFDVLLVAMFVLAVLVFINLLRSTAPYGRHARSPKLKKVGDKLGWVIMELPAVVVFAVCYGLGDRNTDSIPLVFLCLWQIHYLHRTFIYPFRIRGGGRNMTVAVMSFGFIFNGLNGYLNGRFLTEFSSGYASDWATDPRFIIGVVLFCTVYAINYHSDGILRSLRQPGETGHRIPRSGLFKYVTSPNYFGEILEWCGWAVATWSLPGLAFAVWTAANLVPRARVHHRWYKRKFEDYPENRRVIIPFVY